MRECAAVAECVGLQPLCCGRAAPCAAPFQGSKCSSVGMGEHATQHVPGVLSARRTMHKPARASTLLRASAGAWRLSWRSPAAASCCTRTSTSSPCCRACTTRRSAAASSCCASWGAPRRLPLPRLRLPGRGVGVCLRACVRVEGCARVYAGLRACGCVHVLQAVGRGWGRMHARA